MSHTDPTTEDKSENYDSANLAIFENQNLEKTSTGITNPTSINRKN